MNFPVEGREKKLGQREGREQRSQQNSYTEFCIFKPRCEAFCWLYLCLVPICTLVFLPQNILNHSDLSRAFPQRPGVCAIDDVCLPRSIFHKDQYLQRSRCPQGKSCTGFPSPRSLLWGNLEGIYGHFACFTVDLGKGTISRVGFLGGFYSSFSPWIMKTLESHSDLKTFSYSLKARKTTPNRTPDLGFATGFPYPAGQAPPKGERSSTATWSGKIWGLWIRRDESIGESMRKMEIYKTTRVLHMRIKNNLNECIYIYICMDYYI